MKKLSIAVLSALLVFGMTACGKKEEAPKERTVDSFSADVLDDHKVYGMVGPGSAFIGGQQITKTWGAADGSLGLAKAVSLQDVAKKDIKLAEAFEKKDLKGLYAVSQVELGHQKEEGYVKGCYNEKGEYLEVDGVFTVKFVLYTEDDLTGAKVIDTWIPSPEAYSDSLTPNLLWAPIHQEEKDAHGLAHDSDTVNFGGAGEYTYFLGVYKKAVGDSFYGLGVVKDKALDPYVAPEGQVPYSIPGQWNGWANDAEMVKVSDNEFKAELTVAAGDNGRIVETGSWTTAADFTNVTTGADLVEDDNGGDHNFKFKAAGTYVVTYTVSPKAVTIVSK